MKKNNRIWAAALAAACILCLAAFFLLRASGGGTIAVITIDGEEYERIDLSKVQESYRLEIRTEYGYNCVLVEPGSIRVTEADCPDGVCVRQGAITNGGVPIVCMPHRLVIEIEDRDIDA